MYLSRPCPLPVPPPLPTGTQLLLEACVTVLSEDWSTLYHVLDMTLRRSVLPPSVVADWISEPRQLSHLVSDIWVWDVFELPVLRSLDVCRVVVSKIETSVGEDGNVEVTRYVGRDLSGARTEVMGGGGKKVVVNKGNDGKTPGPTAATGSAIDELSGNGAGQVSTETVDQPSASVSDTAMVTEEGSEAPAQDRSFNEDEMDVAEDDDDEGGSSRRLRRRGDDSAAIHIRERQRLELEMDAVDPHTGVPISVDVTDNDEVEEDPEDILKAIVSAAEAESQAVFATFTGRLLRGISSRYAELCDTGAADDVDLDPWLVTAISLLRKVLRVYASSQVVIDQKSLNGHTIVLHRYPEDRGALLERLPVNALNALEAFHFLK